MMIYHTNINRCFSGILFLILFGVGACQAKPSYETLPKSEHPVISADFDGDGVVDTAGFQVRDYGFDLIVRTQAGPQILEHFEAIDGLVLSSVPAGAYASACAKGAGRGCKTSGAADTALTHAAIEIARPESAAWIYVLDGGKVRKVFLAD